MTRTKGAPRADVDDRDEVRALFAKLKAALPKLKELLDRCSDHWGYEDPIYRFYHQSYKVYGLQETTSSIVQALQALAPDRPLNEWFVQIVKSGTGKTFEMEHNKRWIEETRPHPRGVLPRSVLPRDGGALWQGAEAATALAAERVGRVPLPLQPALNRRLTPPRPGRRPRFLRERSPAPP